MQPHAPPHTHKHYEKLQWRWQEPRESTARIGTLTLDPEADPAPHLWRMQRLLALSHGQLQGRVEAVCAENDRLQAQVDRLTRSLQGQERQRQEKEQELFVKVRLELVQLGCIHQFAIRHII